MALMGGLSSRLAGFMRKSAGPLVRVLPGLSAAEREKVRATLEVYFRGHAASQGIVFAGRDLGGASGRLTVRSLRPH